MGGKRCPVVPNRVMNAKHQLFLDRRTFMVAVSDVAPEVLGHLLDQCGGLVDLQNPLNISSELLAAATTWSHTIGVRCPLKVRLKCEIGVKCPEESVEWFSWAAALCASWTWVLKTASPDWDSLLVVRLWSRGMDAVPGFLQGISDDIRKIMDEGPLRLSIKDRIIEVPFDRYGGRVNLLGPRRREQGKALRSAARQELNHRIENEPTAVQTAARQELNHRIEKEITTHLNRVLPGPSAALRNREGRSPRDRFIWLARVLVLKHSETEIANEEKVTVKAVQQSLDRLCEKLPLRNIQREPLAKKHPGGKFNSPLGHHK